MASNDLNAFMQRQAIAATATTWNASLGQQSNATEPAGTAATPSSTPSSPLTTGQEIAEITSPQVAPLAIAASLPGSSFRTQSVGADGAADDALSSMASSALYTCPSFLYGSWLRVENVLSDDSSSSSSSSSVLMRFTSDSVERIQTTLTAAAGGRRRRVQQQRWSGPLQVECEWSSEQQIELEGEGGALSFTTPSSSADLNSSGLVDLTVQVGASHYSMQGGSGAAAAAAAAPLTLRFTYLPLTTHGGSVEVLVERNDPRDEDRAAHAQTSKSESHQRAFVRVTS